MITLMHQKSLKCSLVVKTINLNEKQNNHKRVIAPSLEIHYDTFHIAILNTVV